MTRVLNRFQYVQQREGCRGWGWFEACHLNLQIWTIIQLVACLLGWWPFYGASHPLLTSFDNETKSCQWSKQRISPTIHHQAAELALFYLEYKFIWKYLQSLSQLPFLVYQRLWGQLKLAWPNLWIFPSKFSSCI